MRFLAWIAVLIGGGFLAFVAVAIAVAIWTKEPGALIFGGLLMLAIFACFWGIDFLEQRRR